MKSREIPHLSIFDTFKTKSQELTGEANRQRSILASLASQSNPIDRTRTSISQQIAEENGIIWKNIYSGIFRDLDEILIPLGLVAEEGRLPLKRGPKALQEKGIPYYHLTAKGKIAVLAINEIIGREKILQELVNQSISPEREQFQRLEELCRFAPRFTFHIFEKYVKSYCEGEIEKLAPFSLLNFKNISDESIKITKELLEGFLMLSKSEREETMKLFDLIY